MALNSLTVLMKTKPLWQLMETHYTTKAVQSVQCPLLDRSPGLFPHIWSDQHQQHNFIVLTPQRNYWYLIVIILRHQTTYYMTYYVFKCCMVCDPLQMFPSTDDQVTCMFTAKFWISTVCAAPLFTLRQCCTNTQTAGLPNVHRHLCNCFYGKDKWAAKDWFTVSDILWWRDGTTWQTTADCIGFGVISFCFWVIVLIKMKCALF